MPLRENCPRWRNLRLFNPEPSPQMGMSRWKSFWIKKILNLTLVKLLSPSARIFVQTPRFNKLVVPQDYKVPTCWPNDGLRIHCRTCPSWKCRGLSLCTAIQKPCRRYTVRFASKTNWLLWRTKKWTKSYKFSISKTLIKCYHLRIRAPRSHNIW
jgi:hypothetical protein